MIHNDKCDSAVKDLRCGLYEPFGGIRGQFLPKRRHTHAMVGIIITMTSRHDGLLNITLIGIYLLFLNLWHHTALQRYFVKQNNLKTIL